MKSRIATTIIVLSALFMPQMAGAVTHQEMEQARVIAIQTYLRFANDGSGYLDDVKVKTLAELKGKLKAKELENIKAVEKIQMPGDYEQWDKEKFINYWGKTFFSSPGLDPKGCIGKTRAKNKIAEIQVTAPGAKAEEKAAPKDTTKKVEAAPEVGNGTPVSLSEPETQPVAEAGADAVATADTVATEEPQPAEEKKSSGSAATWIYVIILAILIGVVVWLVIYASRAMKESAKGKGEAFDEDDIDDEEDDDRSSAHTDNAIIEKLRKENDELRYNNANLQTEVQALNRRLHRVETERDNALKTLEAHNRQASEASRLSQRNDREPLRATTRTFYLGRVNDEGVFVRADKEYNPSGSIYRFVTTDGVSGSFYVIDSAESRELISLNPKRMLAEGCTGVDFAEIDGDILQIETLSPGTAVLDGKRFRMVRKAKIQID